MPPAVAENADRERDELTTDDEPAELARYVRRADGRSSCTPTSTRAVDRPSVAGGAGSSGLSTTRLAVSSERGANRLAPQLYVLVEALTIVKCDPLEHQAVDRGREESHQRLERAARLLSAGALRI
jgi:hypothetical protein